MTLCNLRLLGLSWHGYPGFLERGLRSYITDVVKYCERKGNEKLIKPLAWSLLYGQLSIMPSHAHNTSSVTFLRADKYNKSIQKYYVEIDEEDEDVDEDLEKCVHESVQALGVQRSSRIACFM